MPLPVTLRPNVWYDGPVALLDELYTDADREHEGSNAGIPELTEVSVRA